MQTEYHEVQINLKSQHTTHDIDNKREIQKNRQAPNKFKNTIKKIQQNAQMNDITFKLSHINFY